MKKRISLLLVASLFLITTACTTTQHTPMEQDLAFLCSKECFGRLPGTPGNEKARDYIFEQFEAAGLETIEGSNSYLQPYTQQVFDSESKSQTLTATYADGSVKTFTSGEDFYPYRTVGGTFEGTVSPVELTDKGEERLAVSISEGVFAGKEVGLIRTDWGNASLNFNGTPLPFSCGEDLFDALKTAVHVSLEGDLQVSESTVHNVVGVLPGVDRTQAMLVSAHFDHLGGYENVYYSGAIDNASGCAALLQIVRDLSGRQPPVDVVFVAFNGEDMGLKGSDAFAETKLPYERMNAINIDTVGLLGGDGFTIGGDEELGQAIAQFWTDAGLNARADPIGLGNSDHVSLNLAGIPAVIVSSNLPREVIAKQIHYPTDTVDHLDLTQIESTAKAISDYITTQIPIEILRPLPESSEGSDEYNARMKEVLAQAETALLSLHPGPEEVVFIKVDGATYLVRDVTHFDNPTAFQERFPESHFPAQLGDFTLCNLEPILAMGSNGRTEDGTIAFTTILYTGEDEVQTDRVYPLPDAYQTSAYSISYMDDAAQKLFLSAHSREHYSIETLTSDWDRTELVPIDGGTIMVKYVRIEEENKEYPDGVLIDHPDLPAYVVLSKIDLRIDLSGEDLVNLAMDAMPELEQLPRLS